MIYTLTLNPAVDRDLTVPAMEFDSVLRATKSQVDFGGKSLFVAVLAAGDKVAPLWSVPVKRLGRIRGSEGVLEVAADRIVYNTGKKDQSRTWRFRDIDNISTSDPFQLTVTTFERSKLEYGNRKGFNFELKQPLDEKRFNLLWRQLNQAVPSRGPGNETAEPLLVRAQWPQADARWVQPALEQVGDEYLYLLLAIFARQLWFHFRLNERWQRYPQPRRIAEPVILATLLWACIFLRGASKEFIYFQF